MTVQLSRAGFELVVLDGQLQTAIDEYNRWHAREREAREMKIAAHKHINKLQQAVSTIKESL